MKLKDLKIGTILLYSFSLILTLVVTIGFVGYYQTERLHNQIEVLHKHPLQIRRAIYDLKSDISEQRIILRDLILEDNIKKYQEIINRAEVIDADIEMKFDIIKESYLGPSTDITSAYNAYTIWKNLKERDFNEVLNGNSKEVIERITFNGAESIIRDDLLEKIESIDIFAKKKADELYISFHNFHEKIVLQLTIIVSGIFALTLIIGFWLYNFIRKPIFIINDSVLKFQSGDLDSRIIYKSKNEFGALAYSINTMSDTIQKNVILNKQTIQISDKMMGGNNAHDFFKVTLNSLVDFSGAQMAAVYLLSEDKKTFKHFESIGISGGAKEEFLIDELEGEFGYVLLNNKLQHIKEIPNDTRFVFNTVSGEFLPKEIITFPIQSNKEIIAIISLISINAFDDNVVDLIENISDGLTSRIESIISENKVKEFMAKLEKKSSELVEQNTELEIQKQQLSEASKSKSNFLSKMSHELRTPLNSVIALSGVLSRKLIDKIPDEEYGYLNIINRNGKNLLNLLNDILDISKIESGYEEIYISKFNAKKLLDEIIEMFGVQANEKGIELKHNNINNEKIIISDYNKCIHILQNLVGNAIKFTEIGSVTIEFSFIKNKMMVKIIDTGIGISEEFLESIFDEFRQADVGLTRKFGGTGLGLAIVKKSSELLGGTIAVQSQINKGSIFTLTLPTNYEDNKYIDFIRDRNQYIDKTQTQSKSNNLKKKTILLIENDRSDTIQIKELIEGMGIKVINAKGGKSTLKIIDKTIPDAIILGLMKPKINGLEVFKLIKTHDSTSTLPVLVLTDKDLCKKDIINLKRNNIYQLVQKGEVDRIKLQTLIFNMLFPLEANSIEEISISKDNMSIISEELFNTIGGILYGTREN